MPLSPNPDSAAEPRSFEAAYRELQQVVAQLEDGGLDLERAIVLFERGSQLVQLCERIVDQAELRVTLRYFVTAGGMPSSHSAVVVGRATGVGVDTGLSSIAFALAAVFSAVVM